MYRYIKVIYIPLFIVSLTLPLAGCGNDEEEADKGTEEQGVHKPKDDFDETGDIDHLETEK
ncbi:hypothetical protein [Staphylococcus shinii]|uniref:hypothetical protein n=1 Tax=Staphylococcus shinii TaxID=2912228 RepID=UPI003EEF3BE9